MCVHLLCCAHGNECTWTRDVIYDTFATIMQDVNFHMGREQIHVLPLPTFNSSRQWVDNVFTKNGIHILANIVIADLLPQSCTTQGFATSNAIQTRKRNFHDYTPSIDSSL
jgi:hypothetical protein